MDGSSAEKGGVDATYINCFTRSLVFRRVAALRGLDSGTLFLKALLASALVYFVVSAAILYGLERFGSLSLMLLTLFVFIAALKYALCIFFFSFVFNLFLADNFMRIVNIFMFSCTHGILLGAVFIVLVAFQGHVCIEKTFASVKAAETSDNDSVLEMARPASQNLRFRSAITCMSYTGVVASIFYMFSLVSFVVLLIRNIRALRAK